ncbi:MAG: hypothetical protein Q4F56_02470 [Candidatus Saccharibacteria bacterium]|nr:hypothetical protein [Candidatus Saccharibacteria bacterium]
MKKDIISPPTQAPTPTPTPTLNATKQDLSPPYQEYYARKRVAMILEGTNHDSIIAIPSVAKSGKESEWLKLGGNSAYYYKYLIAPRLNKKPPTIRPDTDLNYRFKSGIISIHWRKAFLENMATLNLAAKTESGLIIVKLNHEFTDSEIKKLRQREHRQNPKANQILKPAVTYPDLYHLLLTLAKVLPNKIEKLNKSFAKDYGSDLRRLLAKLLKIYLRMANGHLDQQTARVHFNEAIDDFSAIIIILSEGNALDHSTEHRLSTLILDIKSSVERNLKPPKGKRETKC